jgi:hypothetical protein
MELIRAAEARREARGEASDCAEILRAWWAGRRRKTKRPYVTDAQVERVAQRMVNLGRGCG